MFSSFKIPSSSMEPELKIGDNILVCKPIIGARIFNIFSSMQGEQTRIYRVPSVWKIKRNDILVFNFPYPNNWDKIEMHILKYYVKRCAGLPGDTLSIVNGRFRISEIDILIGNGMSQDLKSKEKASFDGQTSLCFPYDPIINWNIKKFGPLYIPKVGSSIKMDRINYYLYKKIIEWEQKTDLSYKDSLVYLNGKELDRYCFQKSYYFMVGDNEEDSQDSRYWGLLPEEYIVGKACLIWKSVDPHTNKIKWDRIFKFIH